MNTPSGWPTGNPSRKKVRGSYRPKIRWELLGLSDPNLVETPIPIEHIRKEVSSLASIGFGQGTRSRSISAKPAGQSQKTVLSKNRKGRNAD
ncbi:hypothetical protein W02_34820 [Nitrospira sp. KM1]|nr:hypothetical protein W02_34820 [Nitrospira sp. KM1]